MEHDCLITVIIPAYNVESYIAQCIRSVTEQTYRNLEIIVVDDGSKDGTGPIIDELASRDYRIKAIHKENGGVSSARNRGLEAATGDYVVFVDGDDYLANDAVEYYHNLAKKTQSELCLSKNCFTREGESQIDNDTAEILKPEQAVALLLSPQVIVGCWNKIFSLDYLRRNNLRFSEDLFYGEGLNFITHAADMATSVAVGKRKVYYYRRNNEASATSRFSIEKMRNGDHALDLIKNQLTNDSSDIEEMFMLHKGLFALGAITKIINCGTKNEYFEDYKNWKNKLYYYARALTLSRNVSVYRKCMLWGGVISPRLMAFLDLHRRKRISANSFR